MEFVHPKTARKRSPGKFMGLSDTPVVERTYFDATVAEVELRSVEARETPVRLGPVAPLSPEKYTGDEWYSDWDVKVQWPVDL